MHQDAFAPGDRVLVIDDVLATGGTVEATAQPGRACGATVAAVAVLIELGFLDGRDDARTSCRCTSLTHRLTDAGWTWSASPSTPACSTSRDQLALD